MNPPPGLHDPPPFKPVVIRGFRDIRPHELKQPIVPPPVQRPPPIVPFAPPPWPGNHVIEPGTAGMPLPTFKRAMITRALTRHCPDKSAIEQDLRILLEQACMRPDGQRILDRFNELATWSEDARLVLHRALQGWDKMHTAIIATEMGANDIRKAFDTLYIWHERQVRKYMKMHEICLAAFDEDSKKFGALTHPEVVARMEDDMLVQISEMREDAERMNRLRLRNEEVRVADETTKRKLEQAERKIQELSYKQLEADEKVARCTAQLEDLRERVRVLNKALIVSQNENFTLQRQCATLEFQLGAPAAKRIAL